MGEKCSCSIAEIRLAKILMSDGARCNFINLHFAKSALSSYPQWDFVTLFKKDGIAYHEKTLGQLFCYKSSKQFLWMLLIECEEAGVKIQMHCQIKFVEQLSEGYSLQTSLGEFGCDSLVVASGRLPVSTMGASEFGYDLAEQFGLDVLDRSAALAPLAFSDQ